jgi:hypothetical protein
MRIVFHSDGHVLSTELREFVEASLRQAFHRFAGRIRRVGVSFWDTNGPRGGADKGVRLIVELIPLGEVLVRETDASAFAAVVRATSRARHAVRKELRRRWAGRRRSAQRVRATGRAAAVTTAAGL